MTNETREQWITRQLVECRQDMEAIERAYHASGGKSQGLSIAAQRHRANRMILSAVNGLSLANALDEDTLDGYIAMFETIKRRPSGRSAKREA